MGNTDDPRLTTTSGHPPSIADGPAPEPIDPKTGQHRAYWVFTPEERAKGFVRPVRRAYLHKGIKPKYELRPLTDEEKERYAACGYVGKEDYPDGSPEAAGGVTGRFWTQAQLDSGCGVVTTMGVALSETWARDPKYYGATFCCGCRTHLPVEEFVWDDDGTVLGS